MTHLPSVCRSSVLLACLAGLPGWSRAEPALAPAHACDRLAAILSDQGRPLDVPGVLFKDLDVAAAGPACEAASQAHPSEARFKAELSRVRQKQGLLQESARLSSEAAAQGYAASQVALGAMYYNGRGGLDKDQVRAAQLAKLAAGQGNRAGLAMLADYYLFGLGGLDKDEREAMRLYRLAANAGDAGAQVQMGGSYRDGRHGLVKDEPAAARYYRLAADQGHPAGQVFLAESYLTGRGGLPVDRMEAVRLLRLAADQNEPVAQHLLGWLHERGLGRDSLPDMKQAIDFYRQAARNGYAASQQKLRTLGETW